MTSTADWEIAQLVDRLVAGLTAENSEDRVRLLARKLHELENEAEFRFLLLDGAGTLESLENPEPRSAVDSYVSGLIRALRRAMELGAETDELAAWLEDLPSDLRGRANMWLLHDSVGTAPEKSIEALAHAVESREPTGDDVRLLDALDEIGSTEVNAQTIDALVRALPLPPPSGELGRALASASVPSSWRRGWLWASVLEVPLPADWTKTSAIMESRFGARGRDFYRMPTPQMESFTVGSPISRGELEILTPVDAMEVVADWRPEPHEFRVSARELGRTLESVVAENAREWAEDPVSTVASLHHPTYVAHYIQGLAKADAASLSDRGPQLIEALEFLSSHPWEAVPLGDDATFDYDSNWEQVDTAGVDLIQSLAGADIDLGDNGEIAWTLIVRAVRQTDRGSGLLALDRDPYEAAINRPCTRALEAVLHFIASESRTSGLVREEAFDLLDWVLGLEGRDGLEFRSVLGSKIGFLRFAMADWVDDRADVLFGDEAPGNLGVETLRSAVRWAQPNKWVLETWNNQIIELARHSEDRALDQALIAMVWGIPGYETERLYSEFASVGGELVSQAGERLARLLRPDDVSADLVESGVAFWELVLADGFGDGLRGFGWWTEVRHLPRESWEHLMLRTTTQADGELDWASQTAARALEEPATTTGFDITRSLLHGTQEPWEKAQIAESAWHSLATAAELAHTAEYRRLRDTLITLGFDQPIDAG